jgi:mRNA-degrading endonuclease RelE of RelBE toxin-antitoxin system
VTRFDWEPAAQADLRAIRREDAMRVLLALTRYAQTNHGDVVPLTDRPGLFRLRVGKWRVFFDQDRLGVIHVLGIDNRGQAY